MAEIKQHISAVRGFIVSYVEKGCRVGKGKAEEAMTSSDAPALFLIRLSEWVVKLKKNQLFSLILSDVTARIRVLEDCRKFS